MKYLDLQKANLSNLANIAILETMFKSLWWRGGVWLTGSAVFSKFLGLWRDRLLLDQYPQGEIIDAIFTAFRLPDFFFFLFIGGTMSTVLVPRLKKLSEKDQASLLQGMLVRTGIGFGALCALGALLSPWLIGIIGKGLEPDLYPMMIELARWLFVSVFFLSLTSVFTSYLQTHEQFRFLALGPIVYTLSLCLSILWFGQKGVQVVGMGAVIGSSFYFLGALFLCRKKLTPWAFGAIPPQSQKNLRQDFIFRVLNNSAFQINQTIDVFLAGFLVAGSVGAFSMGTALGSILLTILGIPLANTFFPRLSQQKNWQDRWQVLKRPLFLIWGLCLPVSFVGIFWASPLLQMVYGLSGKTLLLAQPVFMWTIASLPMMCSIPLLSRMFYGAGDNKNPLLISTVALTVATIFAVWATFSWLNQESILGLAMANFLASTLSFVFFVILFIKKLHAERI